MPLADFRMAVDITGAYRAKREFPKPKPSNSAARIGLRFENRVGKELQRHVMPGRFLELEHNPWFTFYDAYGVSNCSPDFLLWIEGKGVVIVEVKLTWVEVALAKLHELYCPVISTALGYPTLPLVIVRNSSPKAPKARFTLSEALTSPEKLLQWPQTGHIIW